MLPTAYPYDRTLLLHRWRQFSQTGHVDRDSLDPAVMRSWDRCWQAQLAPADADLESECCTPDVLQRRQQAHFDMIAISRPFMEDIYQFVGERGVWVFLADHELCVLVALGDDGLSQALEAHGVCCGASLAERLVGTNAASVALHEGIAVQVVGPEHFCVPLQPYTDTAAPIHAPHGEMLAVLGIVTKEEEGSPHTLGIVMAAARAIENQIQADLSLSRAHQHSAELDVALQAVSKGILFFDPEGRITHINARAAEILHVSSRWSMGRTIRSLITLPTEVQSAIDQRVAVREREVTIVREGKPRACVVSIIPMRDSSGLLGWVFTLELAADVRQLVHHMVGAKSHFTFEDVAGRDVSMRRLLQYARSVAHGDSNVLLLGESGTGKDMFAQAIHSASRRAAGPFVGVNCAALPRDVLAVSLLGHQESFQGLKEGGRPGKFELAAGGTVFLDNVDGLPLEIQANLIPIIDAKEATRLGAVLPSPVDVRIIAASSNADLASEVQRGRFRADLFYRLNVLTLTIPPLRERGNDILLLVANLMDKFGRRLGKKVSVSPDAMSMLQSYHWPGNVRELENVLERAMNMLTGSTLTSEHLPAELRKAYLGGSGERIITLQEAERQAIIRAGRALQGNVTAMAKVLGIGRTTLWRKMKALRMPADSFRG